jgi:hypothetical protein
MGESRKGGVYWRRNVPFSNPTTEELLKQAEDVIRRSGEYLEDFNAALDQLLKRQAEFRTEHPRFGDRYS